MAFTLEYYSQWKDYAGTTHRVELYLDGGPGDNIEIEKQQVIPWRKKTRGSKDFQLKTGVAGAEYIFSFMVPSADVADFDAILESNYKDWKIVKKYDGNIEWTGWVLPENAHRPFIKRHSHYELTLTATDGLAKLKNVEYKDFSTGDQFSDRVSIIQTIKRALEHLELDLDFRVQLNTYETTLMTSSECALDKGTITNYRFTKTKDGREYNENCYTIIEEALKDFNCYLKQEGGYYWIINPQEVDSYYYPITWSGLTVGTRTANDLEVSLSGYDYELDTQLEKIRPLEEFQYRFNDRNLSENLLSNGDFSSGTTGWNSTGYFSGISAASGYGAVTSLYASETPPTYIYTDSEAITKNAEGDQLLVSFKYRMSSFSGSAGTEPLMYVTIYDGTNEYSPFTNGGNIPIYQSSEFATISFQFNLYGTVATNNWLLRIYTKARTSPGPYTSFEFNIDDVYWVPIYIEGTDLTFDRYYKVVNDDSTFLDIEDENVLSIGDSRQDNDLGAIMVGGTRTSAWNRYGKTDGLMIQEIYGQNIIENFAKYKNYVRCTIFDPSHNISSISILNIESKLYQIVDDTIIYEKGVRKLIKCELVEVLNTSVNTTITQQQLTSVDGESV